MNVPFVPASPVRLSGGQIGSIAALSVIALAITTFVGFVVSIDTTWGIPDQRRLPAAVESLLGLSMLAWMPGLVLLLTIIFTRRHVVATALGATIIIAGVFLALATFIATTSDNSEAYFGVVTVDDVISTGGLLALTPLMGLGVILVAKGKTQSPHSCPTNGSKAGL